MARECLKCGNKVPKAVWINGKKRNCQHRKYCLDCSPFGFHNTSQLEKRRLRGSKVKECPDCGKQHDQKGRRCFACYFQYKQRVRWEKVQAIVGSSCWLCGYGKTLKNLCFHHVDPAVKLFGLTTRELMLKWDRVEAEMRKCVFCCCNCHGEIHDNVIPAATVLDVWQKRWAA